ncbi:hypothetical protein CPAR01_10813 [Colletotrichum paranaense]|nr:uncharacterized protein CPAR01_10813 [Colletotrichum paranaense]KAK1531164.1 hypothetical protein CPAR01_10813 [Colletotrichum paranaense]
MPVQSYTSSEAGAERWFQICQKLRLVTFLLVHSRPLLNPKPRVVQGRYLSQLLDLDLTVRLRGIDRWTGTNEDVLKSDGSPATPLTLSYGFLYPRSGTDGGAIFQRLSRDRPEGWTRLGCQEKTHIGSLGSQKLQRKRASCTSSGTPAWELSQSTSSMHPSHLLLPPPPCISHSKCGSLLAAPTVSAKQPYHRGPNGTKEKTKMAVFSLFKKSRQQAKEHKQKQAEKAAEAPKQPYKHIPTHAAIDALAGAPSAFKHEDRPRIMEQNRRRSAMAASGLSRMPGPSLPRVSSSLSHVTYPSAHASPMGTMPRAYSYSGGPPPMPYWQERNTNSIYGVPDGSRISLKGSLKGKEVDRSYASGRNSPSSIKAESPTGSSSRSTSSQEDLEMKPARHVSMPPAASQAPRNPAAAVHTHRLHPSSRRASDASERADGSPKAEHSSPSTDRSKPPPSMRGFSAIPAMTSLPPMQFNNSPATQQNMVASSAASTASVRSSSGFSSFNFNINTGAPFSAPMSGRSSAATTPAACVTPEPVYESVEEEEEGGSYTYAPQPVAAAPSALKQKDRRSTSKSKVTRFTELETIDSHTEKAVSVASIPYENTRRDTTPPHVINNAVAVEMVSAAPSEVVSSNKAGKRLSKQAGSKLTKKSRWSTKSSSAVAV